jgi:uncharacterized membrane protein
MKGKLQFFKTVMVGGLLFLVPIIVLVFIAGKAFNVAKRVAAPMAASLPFNPALDILVANLIAIILIIIVCFLAGLFARRALAKKIVASLENKVLSKFPPYTLIKNMTKSMAGTEEAEGLHPVLIQFDDASQIAYEVERIEGGYVAVFVPGAPNPWSGDVLFMAEDRVKALEIPLASADRCLRFIGKGSGKLLHAEVFRKNR